jgi:lipid II:glycine glycyltransferase (peptidoglycan interpeptide bridge formation enzyme)
MADARDDLKDMQKTFSGLTKGTKERRQALIENNKKVLDLIDTYP